jgi:hypothetical protein
VNSLTATADSPLFGHVAGLHHIYVNARGLPTLKAGGPFPYPDGTIFADDVHEFSVKDGASLEGAKKFVTVMVKNAKKYATTGGWGFQVWAAGDPTKPQVPDLAHSVEACFVYRTKSRIQIKHCGATRVKSRVGFYAHPVSEVSSSEYRSRMEVPS